MARARLRKTCPYCQKSLSAAAFNDSGSTADGLARVCRSCTNARRRHLSRGRERRLPKVNLEAAVRTGDIRTVRKLLAGSVPHWQWVCEATRGGHLDLAQMLLDLGAERNIFTLAAMGEPGPVRRHLQRRPADARRAVAMQPNGRDVTPAHVACASELRDKQAQIDVLDALRVHKADLKAKAHYRGMESATPIFCACWTSGNAELVQWLLNHGAVAGVSELMAALGHFQRHGRGAYDIAEALLAAGVPVDGLPGDRTPLQAFAHHAGRTAISWLLAHGADVNARRPGGRTAAHYAAERNTGAATLALLAEHGANLKARDDDGRTPLDVAELNGKRRIVEWLKTHK